MGRRLNKLKIGSAVLLFLIMAVLVFRPGITGYSVYRQVKNSGHDLASYGQEVENLQERLKSASLNISIRDELNTRLLDQLDRKSDESAEYRTRIRLLENNMSFLKERYESLTDRLMMEIRELKDEMYSSNEDSTQTIRRLEDEYSSLARNSARNICCKAKVDNPRIDSYSVENHRIFCLEGGMHKLEC